ncbi:MAG: hypothetical protein DWQ37_17830 [Planctomycetota bacterium]|nr:MAG: hypothetical protein DWQ37_17830 [Planctomycetota bacterium]
MTLAVILFAARSLPAQDAVLDDYLGSGLHNYYERDYAQAMRHLSTAIEGGSQDPRTYYYRGLAKLRAGDTYGAHEDMQVGAALESADVNQFYPVARSLERVQGPERRTLERYRKLARAQARQRRLEQDAARYERYRRNEAQVLRNAPVGPPPAPLGRPAEQPAAAAEPVPPQPAAAQPPQPMPPAAAPGPAAAPPADTPPPAADDPFAPPPGGDADDPFGAPSGDAADPFGDTPDAGGAVDNPFADEN